MIPKILSQLRADNSKNYKLEVLREHSHNENFQDFLSMCYSPLTKFGIKNIPELPEAVQVNEFEWYQIRIVLMKIANRELTGDAAKRALAELVLHTSNEYREVIALILGKSAKAGISASTVNKVFGDNFIKEAPYMGAKSYSEKSVAKLIASGPCISEVKADGRYANTIITDTVYLESRAGLETVVNGAFDDLVELRGLYGDDCVLNGEIVISGVTRYESNGMVSSFCSINEKIRDNDGVIDNKINKDIAKFNKEYSKFDISFGNVHLRMQYIVWDIISLATYKSYGNVESAPYIERFNWLLDNVAVHDKLYKLIKPVEYELVESVREAKLHFIKVRGEGEEGTILKSLDAKWKDGKGAHQIKFKELIELDLVIKSFNYGTPGTKNQDTYSTINVESSCGKLKTVAGGLKEDMMDEFFSNEARYIGTVCTIECCGITIANGSDTYATMHPRFHMIRDDKQTANTLEECFEIERSSTEMSLDKLLNE